MNKGHVHETIVYLEEEPYLVSIRFSLSYHDWLKLQESDYWKKTAEHLGALEESKDTQTSLEDR